LIITKRPILTIKNTGMEPMKKNFDIVFRLLILAGVIMVAISGFLKVQPAKSITLGFAAVFLIAGLIQLILYKVNPRFFRNKSVNPDEES
jgi:hypothetical protein